SCSFDTLNDDYGFVIEAPPRVPRKERNQEVITPWCNGNTAPFGGVIHGSNPCGVAIEGNRPIRRWKVHIEVHITAPLLQTGVISNFGADSGQTYVIPQDSGPTADPRQHNRPNCCVRLS